MRVRPFVNGKHAGRKLNVGCGFCETFKLNLWHRGKYRWHVLRQSKTSVAWPYLQLSAIAREIERKNLASQTYNRDCGRDQGRSKSRTPRRSCRSRCGA